MISTTKSMNSVGYRRETASTVYLSAYLTQHVPKLIITQNIEHTYQTTLRGNHHFVSVAGTAARCLLVAPLHRRDGGGGGVACSASIISVDSVGGVCGGGGKRRLTTGQVGGGRVPRGGGGGGSGEILGRRSLEVSGIENKGKG